jgi:hypothetical protein
VCPNLPFRKAKIKNSYEKLGNLYEKPGTLPIFASKNGVLD